MGGWGRGSRSALGPFWARQRRSWAGNGSTGQAEEGPGHTNFRRRGGTGDTGSYNNQGKGSSLVVCLCLRPVASAVSVRADCLEADAGRPRQFAWPTHPPGVALPCGRWGVLSGGFICESGERGAGLCLGRWRTLADRRRAGALGYPQLLLNLPICFSRGRGRLRAKAHTARG